jgi:hypothetical protein
MPETRVDISPIAANPLTGSITSKAGNFLPFAWVNVGDRVIVWRVDPSSGEFLVPNLLPEVDFITASAPGYYAQPQGISHTDLTLNFQLAPRPETQFIAWNDGQIVLPSETLTAVNEVEFDLSSGWLWGESNTASEILSIHLPSLDVKISSGSFALEYPATGMGWLYIHRGEAQVSGPADQPQVTVRGGEMLALTGNTSPIPMEPSVIMALHPALEKPPVTETIEPTLAARIQSWLVKAGIGVLQIITFITYILSLATLSYIVLRSLFLFRKKSPPVEEKSNAGKGHK